MQRYKHAGNKAQVKQASNELRWEKGKQEGKWARKDFQNREEAYKKHAIKFLDADLYRLGRALVSCSLRVIS